MELQKANNQIEQQRSLPLIPVGTTADLLKARPVYLQIKDHGVNTVKAEVVFSVEKCIASMGIEMDDSAMGVLASDILEVFSHDSVEDIIQCLKKGRQGKYGFGHNNRRSLNMVLFREWMAKHLEEKAAAREKELQNQKKEGVKIQGKVTEAVKKIVNYDAFKESVEKGKPTNEQENEFQRLRLEYLKNSQKSEDRAGPIEKQIKNAPDK